VLKDRILGGLYGQALGDAWGMPAYFDPEKTWDTFGWVEDFFPGPADHHVHRGLPAGRITDDSEQAFSLAQAYIAAGGVTVEATVQAIIAWYDRTGGDESLYVGPSTRRGVQALKRGADPYTTGTFGDTNGAPMRVSPVGLIHAGDPISAIEDAYLSCVPTHNTSTAISAACAVAAAVAVATREDSTLDAIVAAGMMGAEMGRKKGNRWMGAATAKRIEAAIAIARSPSDPRTRLQRLFDEVGTNLAANETVGSAFGVLVMGEGDPLQTAIYAANLSGDADTVGAIACAMAGAFRGIGAFAPRIIEKLNADAIFASYDVPALAVGIERLATRGKG